MLSQKVEELECENAELKSQLETLKKICGNRIEFPKNCEYCRNFIQHFIQAGSGYHPICSGHCAAGKRIRNCKDGDTCKYFHKLEFGKNFI